MCNATSLNSYTFDQRKGTGCVGGYNTANLNNYLFSNNGGTGPAYSNMCVGVFEKGEDGMDGDGEAGEGNTKGMSACASCIVCVCLFLASVCAARSGRTRAQLHCRG